MQLRCHFLARGPIEVLPRCYYSVSELFKLVTAIAPQLTETTLHAN